MEVHHHSNSPTNHKKRWTHYFWEFLMLFLAVFCGFLAENKREHMVEHKRAKIYASNLYKELLKDSAELIDLKEWTDTLVRRFDTLCMISTQDPPVPKGKLYFFSYYTSQIRYFASEASTAEQLKSSGNLRIMKTEVALKLSEYERRIKSLENDYSLFRIEYETMIALRLKIFDGLTSVQLFGSDSVRSRNPAHRDSVYLLNPPLSNPDAMLMREFIGWVKQESSFWKTNIREFIIPIQKTCGELLQLLRTNYHLK